MSTPAQREAAKRQEKLESMKEQIDEGTLSVRQMTDEEKEKFAPKNPPKEPRTPRRRRPPR
jgi:hypothetical protein